MLKFEIIVVGTAFRIGHMTNLARFSVGRYSSELAAEPASLAGIRNRGNVPLSDGNTRVAALVKRITQPSCSHLSMYVGPLEDGPDPQCIVESDIAAGVGIQSDLIASSATDLGPWISSYATNSLSSPAPRRA